MPTLATSSGSSQQGIFGGIGAVIAAAKYGGKAVKKIRKRAQKTTMPRIDVDELVQGGSFDVGEDIEITDQYGNRIEANIEPRNRRRRRRKLLTASDKSDIAFLVGQLGTGQAGKAAISALLSRRC